MSIAIVGKKIGGWIFNKWPGVPIVGGMRCRQCGKRLNGEFNIYCYTRDTVNNTNMFQCQECGKGEPHWVQLQAEIDAAEHAKWLDYARTDCDVLLERIREAHREGFAAGCTSDTMVEEEDEWQTSATKEVYDTLKKLWSEQ